MPRRTAHSLTLHQVCSVSWTLQLQMHGTNRFPSSGRRVKQLGTAFRSSAARMKSSHHILRKTKWMRKRIFTSTSQILEFLNLQGLVWLWERWASLTLENFREAGKELSWSRLSFPIYSKAQKMLTGNHWRNAFQMILIHHRIRWERKFLDPKACKAQTQFLVSPSEKQSILFQKCFTLQLTRPKPARY